MDEDEKARETLGIDERDWIVTVTDNELTTLKAILRLHAETATLLADKIEKIG